MTLTIPIFVCYSWYNDVSRYNVEADTRVIVFTCFIVKEDNVPGVAVSSLPQAV